MERRDCAPNPEAGAGVGAGGAGSSDGPNEGGAPGQVGGSGEPGDVPGGAPGELEGGAAGAGPVVECAADDLECRVAQDKSPWVVYVADEDTAGVDELFAIKLDLLGEMEPIKLNLPLPEGDVVYADPRCWSPDRSKFFFHVADKEFSDHSTGYVVEFGAGLPSAPFDLSTDLPPADYMVIDHWSPGGEHLTVVRSDGFYVVDKGATGYVVSQIGDLADPVDSGYGFWRSDDELIHTESHADGYSAWRTRREQGEWKSQQIVDKLPAFSPPQLSPDGSSLTYGKQGTGLYAVNVTSIGAVPKLLTTENVYITWSLDGSRFVLVADPNTNSPRVLLGQSPAHQSTPQLSDITDAQDADFSPDGSRLMVWRKEGVWGERLHLFDVAAPSMAEATVTDVVRRSNHQYAFSNAGDLLVTPSQETQNGAVTLQLVSPETGALVKMLDQGPNGAYFNYLWFGEGDDFLLYTKAPELDGMYEPFYVDLRQGAAGAKAQPLPGEGDVWEMMFVPGREALLYTRTAPGGGEKDCQYVDISGAAPAEPVRVNRGGIVQFCGTPWQ